mgnify:CR=1 FL=1
MPLSGKALSLIRHFPDFYSASSGPQFQQLITVLSEALDRGEADLMRVLRSHFVDTAGNTGSQGFLKAQRGDLDQLFALYLERLGGTSQLIQVNAQFQPDDLLQLEALVRAIAHPQAIEHSETAPDSRIVLCCDVQRRFRDHAANKLAQVQRFDVTHARLSPEQWRQPGGMLVRLLVVQDALAVDLKQRLSPPTLAQLQAYQGEEPVPPALLAAFTADINQQLTQRHLPRAFRERQQQIFLAQGLKSTVESLQAGDGFLPDAIATQLARALRKRLPLPLQKPLFTASQVPLTADFARQLVPALQTLLQKPEMVASFGAIAQGVATVPPVPTNLELSDPAVDTLLTAALTAMTRLLAGPEDPLPSPPTLPPFVEDLRQRQPVGSDLMRLNRLLLEASYPYFVPASDIPSEAEARAAVVALLNQAILPDPDFYRRHQSFFDATGLDAEAQHLIEQQARSPLPLPHVQRLNRLLLEAAFPTELQKSYVPYRERLRELIQVLQRGASTRQGIQDIVAANLGIFGDTPAAVAARQTIEIEEYQPRLFRPAPVSVQPFTARAPEPALPQTLTLENPNVDPTPVTLRLRLEDNRTETNTDLAPLTQVSWISPTTGTYFTYYGSLAVGDELWVLADGRLLLNGVAIAPPAALDTPTDAASLPTLVLPVGTSDWRIEALIGELPGRLGQAQFDFARFDQTQNRATTLSPEQARRYRFRVTYELTHLTPGTFLIKVPGAIPGFTDRFDAEGDHPSSQVAAIINRVRAAGIDFAIAYVQTFTEYHRITDWLTVEPAYRASHPLFDQIAGQLPDQPLHFLEHHGIEEEDFEAASELKPYGTASVQHQMSDRLVLSGAFDYTRFDWGNTFA